MSPITKRFERRDRARLAAEQDMIASGLSPHEAIHWCLAWEAEAARQSLDPDGDYFWDAGRGWIDAQRSFVRAPSAPDAGISRAVPRVAVAPRANAGRPRPPTLPSAGSGQHVRVAR